MKVVCAILLFANANGKIIMQCGKMEMRCLPMREVILFRTFGLAKIGVKCDEIIKLYYTGVELTKGILINIVISRLL